MNLVIRQRDVVLVDCVPLLDAQLFWPRACLCCHQLFQVPYRVVLVALYAHLGIGWVWLYNEHNTAKRNEEQVGVYVWGLGGVT